MSRFIRLRSISVLILMFLSLVAIVSCEVNKGAIVFGSKWDGQIRTHLAPVYEDPGKAPFLLKDKLKFEGWFSDLKGDLSKAHFIIDSTYFTIKNDKLKAGEVWSDIWFNYFDSGVKSDGSREVFIQGRCFLTNKKLNIVHPAGSLDFDLWLFVEPNKPYRFIMKVKTTKKGSARDLEISGSATSPDGVITFTPAT